MNNPTPTKVCSMCRHEKPVGEFHAKGSSFQPACKPCRNEARRIARRIRSEFERSREAKRQRNADLRRYYGIDTPQYDQLVEAQEDRCGICERSDMQLHVDHDHATGEIRGLLCRSCNTGLGLLGDDPRRLEAAIAWIDRDRRPAVL